MSNVILHLCDWNMQDKYYEAPVDLVRQLGLDIKAFGISGAWNSFKENIDFDDDGSKPVKCFDGGHGFDLVRCVNRRLQVARLDLYFMDWDAPSDSLKDWEETFEAQGEKASEDDVAKEVANIERVCQANDWDLQTDLTGQYVIYTGVKNLDD